MIDLELISYNAVCLYSCKCYWTLIGWLISMLLLNRSGLLEKNAVEAFHDYCCHLFFSFLMYNFKSFQGLSFHIFIPLVHLCFTFLYILITWNCIYIGSIQPRAVHPLPNAEDVYLLQYLLPCFCSSWSPSLGSSMIVAVPLLLLPCGVH